MNACTLGLHVVKSNGWLRLLAHTIVVAIAAVLIVQVWNAAWPDMSMETFQPLKFVPVKFRPVNSVTNIGMSSQGIGGIAAPDVVIDIDAFKANAQPDTLYLVTVTPTWDHRTRVTYYDIQEKMVVHASQTFYSPEYYHIPVSGYYAPTIWEIRDGNLVVQRVFENDMQAGGVGAVIVLGLLIIYFVLVFKIEGWISADPRYQN